MEGFSADDHNRYLLAYASKYGMHPARRVVLGQLCSSQAKAYKKSAC